MLVQLRPYCIRAFSRFLTTHAHLVSIKIADAWKFHKSRFQMSNAPVIPFNVKGDIHFSIGFTQTAYANFYMVISTEVRKKVEVFDIGILESNGYVFAMVQFVNQVGHVSEER